MQTLLLFIIILGILVFVHELGHFLVARRNGCKVYEFGFGFPPRIAGFKKVDGKYTFFWGNKDVESEDTIYSINALPLGGFVRIKGENGEGKGEDDSFASKSAWARIKVLAAGVTMNFLLAALLLSFAVWFGLPTALDGVDSTEGYTDVKTQIVYILPNSAARESGLYEGDEILSVDNRDVMAVGDVAEFIKDKGGQEVTMSIKRGDEQREIMVTPELNDEGVPLIGVQLAQTGIKKYPWYQSIYMGVKLTGGITYRMVEGLGTIVKNLVVKQEAGADLAGPVGIAILTGRVANLGFSYLLQFMALLSINLGVINILPIPALDGGRIVFVLIEKLRGKPISQKVENTIHAGGFFALILLVIVITFKDIVNFF